MIYDNEEDRSHEEYKKVDWLQVWSFASYVAIGLGIYLLVS